MLGGEGRGGERRVGWGGVMGVGDVVGSMVLSGIEIFPIDMRHRACIWLRIHLPQEGEPNTHLNTST